MSGILQIVADRIGLARLKEPPDDADKLKHIGHLRKSDFWNSIEIRFFQQLPA